MNILRYSMSSVHCSDAMTDALRGSPSRIAISPKKSPGLSVARMALLPSEVMTATCTRPDTMTKNVCPSSSSSWTITSFAANVLGIMILQIAERSMLDKQENSGTPAAIFSMSCAFIAQSPH